MNARAIFRFLALILIPLYVFMDPIIEYLHNSDKIIYVMDIPSQPNEHKNTVSKINFDEIDIVSFSKIEKEMVESWVISYPEIKDNKGIESFILKLKNIGIKSFFFIKKNKNTMKMISIGPYVDHSMAISMKKKVNRLIQHDGKIIRINN